MNYTEPSNSWEISYVIAIYRPNIDLGMPKQDIFRKLTRERAEQLRNWASDYFTGRWLRDHI